MIPSIFGKRVFKLPSFAHLRVWSLSSCKALVDHSVGRCCLKDTSDIPLFITTSFFYVSHGCSDTNAIWPRLWWIHMHGHEIWFGKCEECQIPTRASSKRFKHSVYRNKWNDCDDDFYDSLAELLLPFLNVLFVFASLAACEIGRRLLDQTRLTEKELLVL